MDLVALQDRNMMHTAYVKLLPLILHVNAAVCCSDDVGSQKFLPQRPHVNATVCCSDDDDVNSQDDTAMLSFSERSQIFHTRSV